jgi:glycosyltransferase involved in cell wall biosynthesis
MSVPPVPVLFLLPALPVGGAERQIATLARGLDPRRFRAVVACQHALGPVAEELATAGVRVHLLGNGRRRDPGFVGRVASLARSERVRVIVSHGFSTGVAARLAGCLSGVPVRILAEHSTGERDMSPGRHRVNRLLVPLTTAWVAVAHGQREYLEGTKGVPAGRLHVIPNGIDPGPFSPVGARARIRAELAIPLDAPVAGMLAVLRPEKDARTFLLAARFVVDELPAARFLLVGDGPEREHLLGEARVLNLSDHARLIGRRRDVPAVLTAFDVSVLCSTDVETFPLAFLESMATGLPLIGTRVGGLPEMIDDGVNGLLVRSRDPRGLADAMLRVLRDAELRRAWGEASRRKVESEFGEDRMIRAYEDLFRELLRARRAWPFADA